MQELIDGPRAQQIRLDGTIEERTAHQFELEAAERRKQIDTLTIDRERLVQAHGALAGARTLPFVWDIAFVEIFSDDRRGFDIVIGNPPYVRQENILDPKLSREEITDAEKKAFNKTRKAKFARSVYQYFPRFFGYKREKDIKPDNPSTAVSHKIDAKSDLYIYFYFHGLSLLNPERVVLFHHLQFVARCRLRKRPAGVHPQALPHQTDYRQSRASFLRICRRKYRHLSLLRARQNTPVGVGLHGKIRLLQYPV